MFKKTIKYVDFNGTERTEDFFFHMSTPEATRLQAKFGAVEFDEYANNLAANKDLKGMINFIEDLILSSYGKKSEDGLTFLKNPKIREEFEYSQAYAELFEELLTNSETMEQFAQGIASQTKQLRDHLKAVPKPTE